MNVGIIGSGQVAQTIGKKLIELGHDVMLSSRDPQKLNDWAQTTGAKAGTFAEAASFGDLLFNCASGAGSLEALNAAGAANLGSKVLIDLSNPLDFSKGFPPTLLVANTDSLGEQIQRAFPNLRVVKSLNTVNMELMVNAGLIPGDHTMFVGGNDADAKTQVTTLLQDGFGWQTVIDLGDITAARALEMMVMLWVRLYMKLQTGLFNIQVVKP